MIFGLLPMGYLTVLAPEIAEVGGFHVHCERQSPGNEEFELKGCDRQHRICGSPGTHQVDPDPMFFLNQGPDDVHLISAFYAPLTGFLNQINKRRLPCQ